MTKIQAHRGACSERPENTMAAFRRAIELHADGIETDVALLADGSLIIHHDDKFGRTVPGLSGFNLPVVLPMVAAALLLV